MLMPSSTPNQMRSMPSAAAAGPTSGTTMKASSKKSRKKASTKIRHVDDDQEADLAARQSGQQALHPDMPVDAVEGQAEDPRADQDEEHEGGELDGASPAPG